MTPTQPAPLDDAGAMAVAMYAAHAAQYVGTSVHPLPAWDALDESSRQHWFVVAEAARAHLAARLAAQAEEIRALKAEVKGLSQSLTDAIDQHEDAKVDAKFIREAYFKAEAELDRCANELAATQQNEQAALAELAAVRAKPRPVSACAAMMPMIDAWRAQDPEFDAAMKRAKISKIDTAQLSLLYEGGLLSPQPKGLIARLRAAIDAARGEGGKPPT